MNVSSISEDGLVKRFGAVPAGLLIGLFFVLPLGALVVSAGDDHGSAFMRLAQDPLVLRALGNSIALACGAGTVSLAIGLPLAIAVAALPPGRRRWLLAMLGIPLAFSGLVIAYGFILAFGRAGFVTSLLAQLGADPASVGSFIYTTVGLVAAYAYYLVPRVALMLFPAIANLDRGPLEAALTLGASPLRAYVDVALRELWPSIAAAWCLVTSIALGTYGTALALAGTQINILPLLMYLKLSDGQTDFPLAAAMSLLLTAGCTCVLALGECLVRKRKS